MRVCGKTNAERSSKKYGEMDGAPAEKVQFEKLKGVEKNLRKLPRGGSHTAAAQRDVVGKFAEAQIKVEGAQRAKDF